ncbi:MAG: hypothetical protein K0V04_25665, partial [Deltaproteobacteria bacterium]|nr:hypothetical protein [Deltaproteobacteria bacterium]
RRALAVLMAEAKTVQTAAVALSVPAAVWPVAGGLLAAGAMALVLGRSPPPSGDDRPPVAAVATSASTLDPPTPTVVPGRNETVVPPTPRAPDRPIAATSAAAAAVPRAPAVPSTATAVGSRPATDATTPSRSPSPSTRAVPAHANADDLAEQTRLLQKARRALDQGNPTTAATLLRTHARTFSSSLLAPERTRLEIAVKCAQGDERAATILARGLAGIHPPNPICPQ